MLPHDVLGEPGDAGRGQRLADGKGVVEVVVAPPEVRPGPPLDLPGALPVAVTAPKTWVGCRRDAVEQGDLPNGDGGLPLALAGGAVDHLVRPVGRFLGVLYAGGRVGPAVVGVGFLAGPVPVAVGPEQTAPALGKVEHVFVGVCGTVGDALWRAFSPPPLTPLPGSDCRDRLTANRQKHCRCFPVF